MAYAVGLVVLVVGLLVSIALHEIGHLVPAKRFGVRVSRYMVGFGPTLWSRTEGETEYGLKAIPLGGYVRLIGMFPPADVVGARPRAGRLAELASEARQASAEEIRPGEDHRAFYRLSAPKKVTVMLGGPMMNLLIAFVLLAVVLVGFGVPGAPTTTVAGTAPCVLPDDAGRQACAPGDPEVPAAEAGLQPGDVMLSYGGVPLSTWQDVQDAIAGTPGSDIPLVVERDGREITLHVSPIVTERPFVDPGTGEIATDDDGAPLTREVRYLGVSPTSAIERQPLSAVPAALGTTVVQTAQIVITLPARLVDVAQAAFGEEARQVDSVVGPVGIGRIAGEITSIDAPGFTMGDRVASLLSLLAALNVALFVFNMIPLLPLDGGHVLGALWEGARRQLARLRGLPRPAPSDVARMMPLAYGVFVVIAVMGVLLIYADIVRPVTIG